jgi:hypothetical protein
MGLMTDRPARRADPRRPAHDMVVMVTVGAPSSCGACAVHLHDGKCRALRLGSIYVSRNKARPVASGPQEL